MTKGPWQVASDIAARVVETREATGWTQEQLAAVIGRRKSAVSNWERGASTPTRGLLERLCGRFGWPVEIFQKGGPRPGDVIKGPIKLEHALGSVGTPDLSAMPRTEGRSLKETYVLGVNDVMEWPVLSPAWKGPAQRAMQWLDAMKDAAQQEREELTRGRAKAETALRDELATVQAELDRLRGLAAQARKPRPG